ncbi:hypothetical protein E1B28_004137 [Marasmius oreades]|uniref:Transmembrane protein n=1 Tax=Marasmius oreades TaxID=181124 RepID=A0A9P7UXY5_9AGAR|nr:uncharacterized protein E1B28_004137 [Marasmius oreades]KAG7096724.1 hypothetical protein E1B28_004137 [Marasmius oreades]
MANLYNFSIPDSSPTFSYSPNREGEDVKSGWKSFYSNSPDSTYDSTHQSPNNPSGTSSHSTSMQGASFEISFMGTAVYIYGSATPGAYTTRLDEKEAGGQPSNGLLASYSGLAYKQHTFSLNVTQAQNLTIMSGTFTVGVGDKGASIKETTVPAVTANSDGSSFLNSAAFQTSGGGTFNTNHDAQGYPRVDTNNAGSSIIFHFSSASALRVVGSLNYDHGAYSATLSPPGGVSTTTRTFNAVSKWFAYDNIIYWESGLDRTQSYTLTLTNLDEGKYLDVHEVVLMDGQGNGSGGGTESGGLGTGPIVGIAAGVVALLVIIGALLLFFWRRRRHRDRLGGPTPAIYSGAHSMMPYPTQTQPLLDSHVEPFELPLNFAPYADSSITSTKQSKAASLSNTRYTPPTHSAMSSSTQQLGNNSNSWSVAGALTQSGNTSQTTGSQEKGTPPSSSTRIVRQETDAGPIPIRPPSPQEEVLPPGYNPAWSSGQS